MPAIRIGLIGLGHWARKAYLPVLKEHPAADVVAVAAPSEATRQYAREQFGDGIATCASWDELLGDGGVDAAMVALPNELHARGIEAALASGKHVFFEPPIGHTSDEIGRILAAMAASTAVVQCDLELRYLPAVAFVREQLACGAIGDALMARVRLWADWGQGGAHEQFAGEGFFPWLGCWYLDLLDCVFAASPTRVSVSGGHAMNGGLMDHGSATLEYPDERIGTFEFSLVSAGDLSVTVSVLGTRGEIEAEITTGCCRWRVRDGDWQSVERDCSRPEHGFVGMRESIAGFLEAIRDGGSVDAGVDVARRIHEGMLGCAQSEAAKASVTVTPLG